MDLGHIDVGHPPGTGVQDPFASSAAVLLVTFVAVLFISWVWPTTRQLDLLWSVPREAERARILRLVLPADALDFGSAHPSSPDAKDPANQKKSLRGHVVQRLSESLSLQHQNQAWQHSWTFRPTTSAARDRTPLLVFINRASGGREGETTLVHLRALLSPQQVVDLSAGHAEAALQSFRSVGRFRVLVCGGDGTVGWVLSLLDDANLEYTPPVAILPLGTGNDLARALGWGGRHPGRSFIPLLEEVDSAQVALLDRWSVSFEDARVPSLTRGRTTGSKATLSKALSITAPDRGDEMRPARALIMQNYLGVGVDAKVALEWHQRRQSAPHQFTSRFRNKVQYVRYGARQLLRGRDFSEMCAQLTIVADGVELELPPGTEGIIVLNIASYGGGSDLWGVRVTHVARPPLCPHATISIPTPFAQPSAPRA